MTLRQHTTALVLATAIALGGVAVTPLGAAHAAPASTPVQPDPISIRADSGLAWFTQFSATGNKLMLDAFADERDALATAIAARLMIDPARMQAAWRAADLDHQVALMAALSQLGVPYRRNTSKPGVGFDCSGLTTYAWAAVGQTLPRNSRAQINAAGKRTRETAQAGDLMYYPGHVMMWLGVDDAIVHSPFTGRTVEVTYLVGRRHNSVRFGDPTG